jgi:hypothetical protein
MENLFQQVCDRLKIKVPELMWIDWDAGQLETPETSYPVQFPCALVDFVSAEAENSTYGNQRLDIIIRVRLAMDIYEGYHIAAGTTSPDRATAVSKLLLVKKVHAALHGFTGSTFSRLVRTRFFTEQRDDILKVISQDYACALNDSSAATEFTQKQLTDVSLTKDFVASGDL